MNQDADDEPVPTVVAATWQRAETLAYSTVTERPDLYQEVVRLVRRTADHLRLLGPGTTPLLSAAERGGELVAAVADDSGIAVWELDLEVVAGAALALRYREVRAEQAARRRLRRIEEGSAVGETWVVVEETGAPEGDPFLPYSRLEVQVADGRGLLVTATPDDDYRGVLHQIRGVRLDLTTGAVAEDPAAPEVRTYADVASREDAAADLRSGGSGP